MSKKSVGLTEGTYITLIRFRAQMDVDTGHRYTLSEAIEKGLLATTLVADYKRYQGIGGERPLAEYEEYWLQGQMEKMETEAKGKPKAGRKK